MKLKQLKPKSFRRGIGAKQRGAIGAPSANQGCVQRRIDMDIQRKAGVHLLLTVAAVFGCAASVLGATGPAIQLSAAPAAIEQARG